MSKTIKFNAGKVQFDEDTKKCTPLPHKGVVTISPSADDEGFFDFVWSPKSDSTLEKEELLLIPGDSTFKPVSSCKTGRVVALTFLSSGDKSLFWLQDVGDDEELDKWTTKDQELVKTVQEIISAADEDETAMEETNHTGSEEQPEVKEEPKSLKHVSLVDHYPVQSLSDVLTEDLVAKHLDSLSPEEIKTRFGDMLPESTEPTHSTILEIIRSEFFRTSNAEFGMNVSENNLGSILASMYGYDYKGEGLEAFLRGIRDAEKKARE